MSINKTFIIAELSANHNNDLDLVIKTIEKMAWAGANAIKIQTYKPESLTLNLNSGYFSKKKDGLWKGFTPWDLYSKASLPYEWHKKIKDVAELNGLIFFSSPFDLEAVDFLENLEVPMYKIASFEITDIPLIKYTASKNKPMIISTGVAELNDIKNAVNACLEANNKDITLLKCTSQYPSEIKDANLNTMIDLKNQFNVSIGLSDHTMGYVVPMTAVSLGAEVIEKHFILNRNLGGPDSSFSMEPDEFKLMVDNVRLVEKSLGNISYNVSEKDKLRRRSLFVICNIKKGEKFTNNNLKSIRPGNGLSPSKLKDVLGKESVIDIEKGTPLSHDMINDK